MAKDRKIEEFKEKLDKISRMIEEESFDRYEKNEEDGKIKVLDMAEGFVDMAKRILCFDEKAVSIYLKVNEKYVTSTGYHVAYWEDGKTAEDYDNILPVFDTMVGLNINGYPATIEMRCTPYEKIKNPVKECEKEEKVKD